MAFWTNPLQTGISSESNRMSSTEHSSFAPPARYDGCMSYQQLRESATPGNEEQDVEPMFPEPLVELDLDELD